VALSSTKLYYYYFALVTVWQQFGQNFKTEGLGRHPVSAVFCQEIQSRHATGMLLVCYSSTVAFMISGR